MIGFVRNRRGTQNHSDSQKRHPDARVVVSKGLLDGVRSFGELEQRIERLPKEQRGGVFEAFAQAYLATQAQQEARCVWSLSDVPLNVLRRLSLESNDYGVDGVVETTLGDFKAYQVKFRSGRASLTWKGDLSNFIGLADNPRISARVLFTNSDAVPSVLNKRRHFYCIRGSDLDRLEVEDFVAIADWMSRGKLRIARKSPQAHQQEAIKAIQTAFATRDRSTAVMACGTGKTLLGLWVAEASEARRILVLVPSLALLRQTLHEWLRQTKLQKVAFKCVCSDPTVKRGTDEIQTSQSDLDFEVSTQPSQVREFLTARFDGVKIVFSTYDSAHAVASALRRNEHFDLGIFDEAHKTAGSEGARNALALDDRRLAIRKRLFFTATPRRYSRAVRDTMGDMRVVYSMDDKAIYGKQDFVLDFAEAARRGLVCRYKVIVSVVTSEEVDSELLRRGSVKVKAQHVRARQVANQLALKNAMRTHRLNKVFSFHESVSSAASFVSDSEEGVRQHMADLLAFHINGQMPTADRERVMRDFTDAKKSLISNVRCLTEGIDAPAVDMVAFMSPRQSRIDIIQAVGRAIRLSPSTGKVYGYVLVPLYLELNKGESPEEAVQRSDFSEIWNVLQAMMEQDNELSDLVGQLQEARGRKRGFVDGGFGDRVEVLGPALHLEQLRQAISTICLERIGSLWDYMLGELRAYVEEHGTAVVKDRLATNKALAKWATFQRTRYKQSCLAADRVARLESVPTWTWQPVESRWMNGYNHLKQFVAREGRALVGGEHIEGSFKLGSWVETQRSEFKRREKDYPSERRRLLEALPKWLWTPSDDIWNEAYATLQKYQKQHGHCRVRKDERFVGFNLGAWAAIQRVLYRKQQLSIDKIRRLEAIKTWSWHTLDDRWERGLRLLVAFTRKHKTSNIPKGIKDGGIELRNWTNVQRTMYGLGKISSERIAKLESVPYWEWDLREVASRNIIEALGEFSKKHGHCRVPKSLKIDSIGVAGWISNQRARRNRGDLPPTRIRQLEALKGWTWNAREEQWQRGYEALVRFVRREKTADIPFKHIEDGFPLAQWCQVQRSFHKAGKLIGMRTKLLEAVKGWNWDPHEAKWEEGCRKLKAFVAKHGHSLVPCPFVFEKYPLGVWAASQRSIYRRGKLEQSRIKKLESLKGWEWNPREAEWNSAFSLVSEYIKREGHARIPNKHRVRGVDVGTWVAAQRSAHRAGKLSEERIKQLETLKGWSWDPKQEDWLRAYSLLVAYTRREGAATVPSTHVEKGFRLGQWVTSQQVLYRKGQISAEAEKRLNALDGWVWWRSRSKRGT